MQPPKKCDECDANLTAQEIARNRRENKAAQYDANAYYCDNCSDKILRPDCDEE